MARKKRENRRWIALTADKTEQSALQKLGESEVPWENKNYDRPSAIWGATSTISI